MVKLRFPYEFCTQHKDDDEKYKKEHLFRFLKKNEYFLSSAYGWRTQRELSGVHPMNASNTANVKHGLISLSYRTRTT